MVSMTNLARSVAVWRQITSIISLISSGVSHSRMIYRIYFTENQKYGSFFYLGRLGLSSLEKTTPSSNCSLWKCDIVMGLMLLVCLSNSSLSNNIVPTKIRSYIKMSLIAVSIDQ